jgi:predicted regulator of Ras-like GTPase activity (Roadblock/LC7/MglB family)
MKQVLEPIARTPGVRLAMLVTPDGVPITVQGERRRSPEAPRQSGPERRVQNTGVDSADDVHALAALGTGWMSEVTRAVAPLSWSAPQRLVLRAARGTLIAMQAPGALLLVVLDSGMRAEDLRLPMEGAVARMQRHLRAIGHRTSEKNPAASEAGAEPELDVQPSILPAHAEPRDAGDFIVHESNRPAQGSNRVSTTGSENPEDSGG